MNGIPSPEDALRVAGALTETHCPGETMMAKSPVAPLETVSAASLANQPVPQRRFLDAGHLIPMRNVTMLSGDGGTGKSLLALQLAVAVVNQASWLCLGVEAGSALYLSAEDDLAELHVRLASICEAEAMDIGSLHGLELADLAGKDAVLLQEADGGTRVTPRPLLGLLKSRLDLLRPRIVVLDNLADVFAGNENARPIARQFVGHLRTMAMEYDCAVVLLAHPSLSGMSSGSGTSGSTAWNNTVRSRLYLKRERDDKGNELDADLRVLETMKANYGPVGARIELRWQDGRFLRTAAGQQPSIPLDTEAVFLELLHWHEKKSINVSPSPSRSYAPTVFAKHIKSRRITADRFERAMQALLDKDVILSEQFGPPSHRRRRLALRGG